LFQVFDNVASYWHWLSWMIFGDVLYLLICWYNCIRMPLDVYRAPNWCCGTYVIYAVIFWNFSIINAGTRNSSVLCYSSVITRSHQFTYDSFNIWTLQVCQMHWKRACIKAHDLREHGADPGFLAVSPQVTLVINPVVSCHTFHQTRSYFPSQRDHSLGHYQIIYCLVTEAHKCE